MRRLGNTLYVTSQGSYLSKDGDCVLVTREDGAKTAVPVHVVDGIVAFGRVSASPFLLGHCAESGVTLSWFTENGRFLARLEGPTRGNVLLRREQYHASEDPGRAAAIARSVVAGKLHNQRAVLRRGQRDHGAQLDDAERRMTDALRRLDRAADLDGLRGIEGEAALVYFAALPALIRSADPAFRFVGRNRRPPRDAVNALLSFVYALLTHDVRSALDGVGLDPQVGFLHRDRPGRPSLALDLVEEFRAWFADRLMLTLVNLGQVSAGDFETDPAGGVTLREAGRKAVLVAYQERKKEERQHPYTEERVPIGLLWQVQARLLASHLRGDLDAYPPFLVR